MRGSLGFAPDEPLGLAQEHSRRPAGFRTLTGLIAVSDRYDRKAMLAAGRVWQRLHLSATARGLAMQPLNQPIEMIRPRTPDRARRSMGGEVACHSSPVSRAMRQAVANDRSLRTAEGRNRRISLKNSA